MILPRGPGIDVARRISKKQLILDYRARHALAQAGERDLRLIQKDFRDRLAGASPPDLSYIASVLRQAGTQVDYEDRYSDPAIPASYAGRLEGVLRFHDLATAEDALVKLDAAYRDYQSASDHAGERLVRTLILRGKQRAESLASSGRVSPKKRIEKREIANWFRIWLESPGLFFGWLEVRKQTHEFRTLFPSSNAQCRSEAANEMPDA
jgi:hypothetical protein